MPLEEPYRTRHIGSAIDDWRGIANMLQRKVRRHTSGEGNG